MKTLLISTTSLWNCGDDFIRKGILDLLQLRPYTRTLWWNRGYGITDTFANDLEVNLRAADYILIAGTPEWIDKTERLYQHSLRNGTPLALVGVGLRGCIRNRSQRKLLERVADSGLVQVCMARDRIAVDFLQKLGFKDVELILDPAFFMKPLPIKQRNNILGWRDIGIGISGPRMWRRPINWVKWRMKGRIVWKRRTNTYNKLMQEVFSAMPEPKLVMVHDNREIDTAEQLFGKDRVFYSTDYMQMLKVYSTATQYVGGRIHGAIPAALHGASVHLIYPNRKAVTIEDSVGLLKQYIGDIEQSIKVGYFGDKRVILPNSIGTQRLPYNAFLEALQSEGEKIRRRLKKATDLAAYME